MAARRGKTDVNTLSVQDRRGERVASIKPSEYPAWRKKWASDNGRVARRVGLVVDTPGEGQRLLDSAAALRRLLASLPPGETTAHVVALCALPAELQDKLEGCDVWKAM